MCNYKYNVTLYYIWLLITKINYHCSDIIYFVQIVRNWKQIRRQLRSTDWDGSGYVPVDQFSSALTSSGVILDSEQLFQVMESLDKDLSGFINYREFFNAVLA